MDKDLNYYTQRFTNLRIDRAHGQAPYQPLLLLSLIELVEQGLISENRFAISPELISIFIKYRNRLSTAFHQANPAQPFYHMSRPAQAFWHLVPIPGHEQVLFSGGKLNTLKKLRDNILYGCFDDELFNLLQIPSCRNSLISWGKFPAPWGVECQDERIHPQKSQRYGLVIPLGFSSKVPTSCV